MKNNSTISLPVLSASSLDQKTKARLFQRSAVDYQSVIAEIESSLVGVKNQGDDAILIKYRQRAVPITALQVSEQELAQGYANTTQQFRDSLNQAIDNIKTAHLAQLERLKASEKTFIAGKDIQIWRRWLPITTVGVYVPGGRANYPSSLLMSVIPAQLAGCNQIVVCVPPRPDGTLPNEVLAAASQLGVTQLFKVGGPQAIAAMTYGTQSIPAVSKIVGPGNQYVNAAKLALFPRVNIDMPAGPSENVIIADDSANPEFVAADIMADAEHAPDSTSIILTDSPALAQQINQCLAKLIPQVDTSETIQASFAQFGAILVTKNLQEAIDLTNEYAPEHLQIMTRQAQKVAERIINAGSVFVGSWTSKSAGDYASGANHVLPTGQAAKMFSGLSVETFGKWVEYQQVTKKGLQSIKRTIETFARVEKLPAHQLSTSIRFKNKDQ